MEKRKTSDLAENRTPAVEPVARVYTDSFVEGHAIEACETAYAHEAQ
jgi:hypothetical protein